MTGHSQSPRPEQTLNLLCLAGHKTIHQLVSRSKLHPVADQFPCHSEAMATILGLFHIPRSPGTLEKNDVTGSMHRELADAKRNLLTVRRAMATDARALRQRIEAELERR